MINFKLKSLLEEKHMTQIELIRSTGIRQPTITAICNNTIRELPINVLGKICDSLNCEPGDFIENIPVENLDKRRTLISKAYDMPITTREDRKKIVENALALSTLDAPEPTSFTKQLADQFIEGNLSEGDILKAAIEKYQE